MPCSFVWVLAAVAMTTPRTQELSVAVLPLEHKGGVTRDAADIVTDGVVSAIRDLGLFSRVVAAKELEVVLGMEQQKQLLNCGSDGCLAEIAGALAVQYILSGSVGRLGQEFVLSLRLNQAGSGVGLASVSDRLTTESAVLDDVRPALERLFRQARLSRNAQVGAALGAGGATPGNAGSPEGNGPSVARVASLAACAAALVGSLGLVLAGPGLATGGVLTRLVVPSTPHAAAWVVVWGPGWLAAVGLGGLSVLVGLGLVPVGGAVALAGFVLG